MNSINYIEYWRSSKTPHLSREELADKCGMSYNGIRLLELGEREAKQSTLIKIALALNVTIDELLHGPQTDPQQKPVVHEQVYEVTIPGKTENDMRREIQDISWKLTGKHLQQLYDIATMCIACQETEDKKNTKQIS